MNTNQYPIHAVNKLLLSKRELYDVLNHSEYYALKLPKCGLKTIAIQYLLEVVNGVHFVIKKTSYN